ncbi:MAG: sensor histidine kinase [Actinomycetota bacterium]
MAPVDSTVVGEALQVVADVVPCEQAILCLDDGNGGLTVHTTAENDPTYRGSVVDRIAGIEHGEVIAGEVVAAPLTAGERRIGVLAAASPNGGRFTEEDLRLVTVVAERTALAIENAGLREANHAKSDFVSMLAHELKGPMTTIVGFGQVLREQWTTIEEEKREHLFGVLTTEIRRLSRLADDLLDLSRIEAGTVRYDMQPVSLPELVDNVLTVHRSLSASHDIRCEISPDLPHVLGDVDRIGQVLINLLANAVRYSLDGTRVIVRASQCDGEVEVAIADEGIGIDPQDHDRVFSKFVHLPKPGWVPKGTGLGLFISQGIVEAHGGRIWLDSDVGRGSTFHFTIPIAT